MDYDFEMGFTVSSTPSSVCKDLTRDLVREAELRYGYPIRVGMLISEKAELGAVQIQSENGNKVSRAILRFEDKLREKPLDMLIVTSHEIGHLEDLAIYYKGNLQVFYACYSKQEESIVDMECRAWMNAATLLHEKRFKEWARFLEIFEFGMKGYCELFEGGDLLMDLSRSIVTDHILSL